MAEIILNINGREVKGTQGQTILQVAQSNNIEIPTLCYDERVKIYGSCGLCVVEVEGVPKLLRACATEARDGMVVETNTQKVRSSRKIALELLLSDHVGDCRPPCVQACPGETDCQGYVGLIANGEYKEALKLIKEQLPLPASIGRVCPHPCEDACRRQLVEEPISIAWLKSFVADIDLKDKDVFMPDIKPSKGKTVAVIGGGPGGLTAAYYLTVEGYDVVIYEAMPEAGGMLRYGIPQYRLPKDVLNKEISVIKDMGVKILTNVKVGKDISLSHIRDKYDAVYLSIGAWKSSELRCPGEELEGVVGGIEFLNKFTTNQPIKVGDKIAVVGGGNTAMDTARTAIRLGAKEVYALYRRTKVEMPAEEVEIEEAIEEGVNFKFLVSPIEIVEKDGRVSKIRLQKMKMGEPDKSGRRRPIPIEGEEEVLEVDSVIASIGQQVDGSGFEELEFAKDGTLAVDQNTFRTNLLGVFAGGDAIKKNDRIAIAAIGDGKKAAGIIAKYLEGEVVEYKRPYFVERHDLTEEDFNDREKEYRPYMPHLSPQVRKTNFEEIVAGYSEEDAKKDAMRCLECGCHDYFECKLFQLANDYDVEPERVAGEVHNREVEDNHPFIHRNPDKCILCGLCVRVCDEVMGIGALGLVHRGFDTTVKPALDKPLETTDCISCGQCISVCPTGALGEKLSIDKSVPVETNVTKTVCSHCSVGCNIDLNTKGSLVVKAVPDKESKVDDGNLCVKGRFGFNVVKEDKRIVNPLIRKEGKLQEVSWDEAIMYTVKKAQGLGLLYGGDSVGISVSDRYTNEEIYLVNKFGKEVLKTNNVASFNNPQEGIKDVLGYDASTNTFDELLSTETILLVGSDVMKDHTIVGLKIKNAVEKGAKLITINPFDSQADEWAYKKVSPKDNVNFLKEVIKALLEDGLSPKADSVVGLEELVKDLDKIVVSDKAREVASIYGKSKKAMVVFSQSDVTVEAAKLIANMAVISGHIGKPRSGIIELKPKNNSQGLVDIGINKSPREIEKGIADKKIKALLIFGEDIAHINLNNLDFLMVQDTHLTETAKKADVVLPGVGFAESIGTFTSAERRIQRTNRAIPPITDLENWEVIVKLMYALDKSVNYNSIEDILNEMSVNIPQYFKLNKYLDKEVFWPINKSAVLYSDGFMFPDKKARLAVVKDSKLFKQSTNSDTLENAFQKLITEKGLV